MRHREITIPVVVDGTLLDPRSKIPIEVTYGYGRFRRAHTMPSLTQAIDSVKTYVSALVPYFEAMSSARWPGTETEQERILACWVSVRDRLDTYVIEIAGSAPERQIPARVCELLDRAQAAFELISGLHDTKARDIT